MNHAEWVKRGRELARSQQSSNWSLGDWAIEGEQLFGTKTASYDAAQKATGISRGILYRHAMLSRHYSKKLRFASIPFFAYYQLKPFPIEFTSRFLPTVADKDLTCRQILARAAAEFGSDPAPRRKKPAKFHPVRLYAGLYNALAERSPDKTAVPAFIQTILEEYLVGEKTERQPTSNAKTAAWRSAVQNAGKSAEGSSRNEGNSPDDTIPRPETTSEEKTPRPTYAERREAQKAEQQPEPRRFAERSDRKYSCKHKLLFIACKPDAWVDGEIPTQFSKRKVGPTRFKTRERADIAAREYQEDRGYAIESMRCEVCKCWHIVGKNYGPFKAAEIDLTEEQREVRITVEDALQQHAQV